MLIRHAAARHAAAVLTVALGLAGGSGCHHEDSISSGGAQPTGNIKCTAVSSAQVAVAPPVVDIRQGIMRISGTVHRQPGVTGPLDGRVDIDLIGPDGLVLDKSLHCHLLPGTVPVDPNQSAAYSPTPFGFVPPAGSTLRARYVDRQTAILENLQDGDLDYNGNGGHVGTDVNRSSTNGGMPLNTNGGGTGS